LHPVPLQQRVRRALDAIGPVLGERGGGVELLSASEDVVELRVQGSADLVPVVEQAVYAAAPEVLEVRCAGQTISLLSMT
jgi:Fe-S cluster biogenesis protein NfuA